MIVVCSDHGDYLGDHWLGEKELFHEESVRTPLILYDPAPAAARTRGTDCDELVEAIDLAPTFVEAAGGSVPDHVLEGRSLLPLVRGGLNGWREAAVSELDYAFRRARLELNVPADRARAWMVRTARWKYVFYEGFRAQLFDLEADPRELTDLGAEPAQASVRAELEQRLFEWARNRRMRITMPSAAINKRTDTARDRGVIIGEW
jgi:arylsulfatase A-like enzyme